MFEEEILLWISGSINNTEMWKSWNSIQTTYTMSLFHPKYDWCLFWRKHSGKKRDQNEKYLEELTGKVEI